MTGLSLAIIAFLNLLTLISFWLLTQKTREQEISRLEGRWSALEEKLTGLERVLHGEMARSREEAGNAFRLQREELRNQITATGESLLARLAEGSRAQGERLEYFSRQLTVLTANNEERLEKMRQTVEQKLAFLQEDNNRKLEEMRATVDEKLTGHLEKRLGESFRLVSERLEQVHQGLGEMQSLAKGVGDLKKVLTNVKTRGTWGEIQLGSLLEQILSSEQYAQNVATKKGSAERVEFAIRLPGRDENEKEVWLPIDAKFPQEDYQKLLEAEEAGSPDLAEEAARQLEQRIKAEAKDIRDKYLDPPHTTDFGIMFLPTEGLYAQVLRRPGLAETLQVTFRVVIAGPTTLAALLNSLQMGFRTLAIEKHSSRVWCLLGTVKQEFGKFGDILDKTHKKLQEATNTIETAARKSRTIEKKLHQVQEMPRSQELSAGDGSSLSEGILAHEALAVTDEDMDNGS